MNPLQTLYINYTESTKASYKYRRSVKELSKNTENSALLDELFDGVCEDEEKAFYAGFKTAVQLLMGGEQI